MKTNSASNVFSFLFLATLLLHAGSASAQVAGPIGTNAPTVTIRTTDGSASEAGDPGAFTVSRGDQTNGDLYVWLQISGTATNGIDYQSISNIVVIPDGARTAVLAVLPIDDTKSEPTENVAVRVVPSPLLSPILQYLVGTPNSASLFLLDNDTNVESNRPPVVSLVHPRSNMVFRTPVNIAITAEARDPDGTVAQVEFFAGDHSLGVRSGSATPVGSTSLYTLIWSNAPAGEFNLSARATDNRGATTTSGSVHITVTTNQPPPPTNRAPVVNLVAPGNGATFVAPAKVVLSADARDTDGFVAAVEFFAGNQSLGVRTNNSLLGIPNNPVSIVWSNVPPGEYTLTAKATDNLGAMSVSPGVRIAVVTNTPPPPPTNRAPVVNLVAPGNGAKFPAPANVVISADARDTDGFVAAVEFFAGNQSLGVRTNNSLLGIPNNPVSIVWSNVPPGEYTLTAKATDNLGAMSVSPGVRIAVVTNTPPPPPTNRAPVVNLVAPGNGAKFPAPANVVISADARDTDGFVAAVEFFAGNQSLGVRTNNSLLGIPNNPVSIVWSNVPPGDYTLTAKATDNRGAMSVSPGVRIAVVTNTPPPPPPTNGEPTIVNIVATDPYASEGLVMWCSNKVVGVNAQGGDARWMTNCPNVLGTNTATFTVRRSGSTSNALRVYYALSGSASNGVDYAALSGVATIAAGQRSAEIKVVPSDDTLPEVQETVVLRLRLPPLPLAATDSPYAIGRPESAAAFIVDNDRPAPPCGLLRDGMFQICKDGSNECFRVEVSTNLFHWEAHCTNSVVDGAIRHLDPDTREKSQRFFRLVPVPCPPREP